MDSNYEKNSNNLLKIMFITFVPPKNKTNIKISHQLTLNEFSTFGRLKKSKHRRKSENLFVSQYPLC